MGYMYIVHTHTGKIYVDPERQLEFLTVGDYGKENNIKADFLGLHKEIHGVAHRDVDLSEKWVATISTQKGCPMRCQFCDCPKFGFHGNVSRDEMDYMIRTILEKRKREGHKAVQRPFRPDGGTDIQSGRAGLCTRLAWSRPSVHLC